MRARLLEDTPARRTFALVFDKGDDVGPELLRWAEREQVVAAQLAGIGGLSEATLAFFDRGKKDYLPIAVGEQVELVALNGSISRFEGKPKLHAHAVLGKRDGSTLSGHLLKARVWPTLEMFAAVFAQPLERHKDDETGLPLL